MNLKRTNAFRRLISLGLVAAQVACVTVNVNFPESAVQKATDDYVRELYRAKEKGNKGTPAPDPSAKPAAWNFSLLPEAQAAETELEFRLDSDKALKIRDRLSNRLDEVVKYKRDGVIGETNDGLVEVHNPAPLKKAKLLAQAKGGKGRAEDPERIANGVVDAENKDRRDLYDEVLATNAIAKGRKKDIQKSFARSFQAESPSGTWVQDADGAWSQKK